MAQSNAERQRAFRARKCAKLAPVKNVVDRVTKFLTEFPEVVPQFDLIMRRFAAEVRDRRKV
jgi:hypothetical protein